MAKRIVSVRMSVDEYAAIEQRAKAAGQSVSEWMRQAVKNHAYPPHSINLSNQVNTGTGSAFDWNRLGQASVIGYGETVNTIPWTIGSGAVIWRTK